MNHNRNLPFPLYGDGLQVRDWLYVLDHARAIALILEKGAPGEVYNVGGSHHCANKQLIERVRGLMKKPAELVRSVSDRPGHDRRYALNCGKLTRLGFRHAFPFEKALKSTIGWYRANESWWRPLKKGGGFKDYYRKQYDLRLKSGGAR